MTTRKRFVGRDLRWPLFVATQLPPQRIDHGLSINQNMAVGWQLRANISVWLGQFEATIEQVARAMRLSPMDPEAFRTENVMARVSLLQGKYDDAVHWATKMVLHQPDWLGGMWVSAKRRKSRCEFAN
jgi:hypothetical protein